MSGQAPAWCTSIETKTDQVGLRQMSGQAPAWCIGIETKTDQVGLRQMFGQAVASREEAGVQVWRLNRSGGS